MNVLRPIVYFNIKKFRVICADNIAVILIDLKSNNFTALTDWIL
jgi:hypothetical protein